MAEPPPNDAGPIRRIVVLVDASRSSQGALEAAAELAARHDAELLSLFVEESDLLRLAGLPFARELGTTSGTSRPLSRDQLERRLRGEAAELRRRLAGLAARHAMRWSLQVARGRADAEALARAAPGDLLVVGKTGWSRLPHQRLGSTPQRLLSKAQVSVMVYARPARTARSPVVALFDDPESGPRTLGLATFLARADSEALTVLIPEPDADRLIPAARKWLSDHGVEATLKPLHGATSGDLAATALHEDLQALVVHRDSPLLGGDARRRLLESLDAPVVLVP
ncbi:universal stress protein [Thiohalorhabdus methylotrophus]|uniref:Universal stress protein n=1 Tax=Thiohalorhabdus methylotrophus TaxID=3242694 RepID=A0ABV4TVS5_9GAMM